MENNSLQMYLQTIDKTRLENILKPALQSDNLKIIDWHHQALIENSATGNIFRLVGNGDDRGSPISWSLILKFTPHPNNDQTASLIVFGDEPSQWNYWRREILFYQSELSNNLPTGLAVPECFLVDEQPEGYWLWLEDITDTYQGQWPLARFGLAAQHLGRFNGTYLVNQEVPSHTWLTKDKDLIREWEGIFESYDVWGKLDMLRKQDDLFRRGWPDEVLDDMLRFWQERDRFFNVLDTLPQVLLHNDSGKKNLLARRSTSGQDETVAIDWGLVGKGSIGEEIACVIFATLNRPGGIEATRAFELEENVFAGYLQGLRDAGWTGDAKLVRLGYLASAALRFGLLSTWFPIWFALEKNRQIITEETVELAVILRRFILSRVDEARVLMATL